MPTTSRCRSRRSTGCAGTPKPRSRNETDPRLASDKIQRVRISSTDGNALEIRVVGYQFPDATDLARRYSWHMVQGSANVEDASWHFRWQALTCDESPRIGSWLRSLATEVGTEADLHAGAPRRLGFTEPNLAFVGLDLQPHRLLLRVELDLEFHRDRAHWRAGQPYLLDLDVSGEQLLEAAQQWDEAIAIYPGKAERARS
jgi:hypothetical protein